MLEHFIPPHSVPRWLLAFTFGLLAIGGYALAQGSVQPEPRTASSQQVGASYLNDLTVSVGGGDLGTTIPLNTSPLKHNNGSVAYNVRMAITITRPDASVISYKQLTDMDGRIRGEIYNSVINQTGTYSITVQVDGGGPSDSATFPIRERAQLDRDDQVFTGENQTFRNAADSATAFRVQNASGDTILNVDTTTDMVTIANLTVNGTCTGCGVGSSESLQEAYDNGNTVTTTDARDVDFTLADTATDANFLVDIATGSTGKFAVQAGGVDTFSIGSTGVARFQNTTNSAAAFDIRGSSGTPIFVADTSDSRIYIGDPSPDTSATLLALDIKTSAGDPTGRNGGMYYNSEGSDDKFRCYENGAWKNCITPSVWQQDATFSELIEPVSSSHTGILFGDDAALYRSAPDTLATDDDFTFRDGTNDIITVDPDATGIGAAGDGPTLGINVPGGVFPGIEIESDQVQGGAIGLKGSGGEYVIGNANDDLFFHNPITLETSWLLGDGQFRLGSTATHPLDLNRKTDDGSLINFNRDGSFVGDITVSAGTVSYNAFSGSHYARTSEDIEPGLLVSMTGENGRLGDREEAEILYGIEKTAQANDSAVLGTYLSLQKPAQGQESASNPSLVTAVGNGEVWVTDTGSDIAPGDSLVSSDAAGHAMKDPGTYAVSHVIAKAAEPVDWDDVTEEADGRKHAKISVLFGAFDKVNVQGDTNAMSAGTSLIDVLFDGSEQQDTLQVTELATVGELIVEGDATFEGTVELNDKIRGKNVEVRDGYRYLEVTFPEPQPDADYAVSISPSWVTAYGVSEKTAEGFRIEFAEAAPADATFDWFVLR
ncbi:MAG: hypothetical protein M3N59_00665 [bacterium]|nr:hypothetical protein [bacterium]